MRHQNTVCHALLKAVPRCRFERLVAQHRGGYRERGFSFWSQFVTMVYAQLSGASSLRELVAALGSHGNLLYHLGLGGVRRSTIADANRDRPAGLFAAVFDLLLPQLTGRRGSEARQLVRLIDATSLRLSDTLCGWAGFSVGYAAVKLHLVYDPQAECPTYFAVTPARVNDIVEAKKMPIEPGATYVFDLGFYDFGWWAELDESDCRFVTRLKDNSPVTVLETAPVTDPAILSDRRVRLTQRLAYSRKNPYQKTVREIIVRRDEGKTLRLLTNDLEAPAAAIAELYRTRWQIELFFKWVKQNLRIKRFLGTSENAVRIQIVTALIAYLLIRIAQQSWPCSLSMQDLARLIRANLMHRKPIPDLFSPPPPTPPPTARNSQLAMALTHA